MVRIRLKRMGRRNKPSFRLTAVDIRGARDGRVLEELGAYIPAHKHPAERLSLKMDRIQYWLSVGAQPTDTVRDLLKKIGKAAQA
ncbi:MAG TPA: 30S ribosomal protein S16 [Phycisphaerae bacterium]|nr:30S ribosomal protein S16 [Phycisphaerae bacterium]